MKLSLAPHRSILWTCFIKKIRIKAKFEVYIPAIQISVCKYKENKVKLLNAVLSEKIRL